MVRRLYLTCVILTFCLSFGHAADTVKKVKPKAVLQYDTALVQVRHFDTVALANYSKQPAFKYNDGTAGPSLWAAFWKWFWDKINKLLSWDKHGAIGFILKYLLIALGLAAIIFVILKLAGADIRYIFRRKPASDLPYSESIENIHEINFDEGIEQATAQHNYRLAVRLLYLKCLQQLNDAGKIHWELNKTNNDYMYEISDQEQRIAFGTLTRQFEYIWYGEFTIDAPVFTKVRGLFSNFNNKAA